MTQLEHACKSVWEVLSVWCVWHGYDTSNEISVLPICAPFTLRIIPLKIMQREN